MKTASPTISVEGTLDLITAAEIMPPGRFIQAKNYDEKNYLPIPLYKFGLR